MTEGEARRFLTAPLPEGDDEGNIEDFTAFETGHAGDKARRLAYDRPCAGTFKTADGGRNARLSLQEAFPEGSGIRFGGGAGD